MNQTNSTSTEDAVAPHAQEETRRHDAYGGSRGRLILWWLHGATRLLLAVMLLFNGVIKLGLWQYGRPDVGQALITLGEMSPMGLLGQMVGFSPLFQVLAGVAEVGAAVALLWRRTVVLGALISAASMTFILVLNLGYDMPAKQLAIVLLAMSLIVLSPWAGRVVASIVGDGTLPAPARPQSFRSARVNRIAGVVAPTVGLAVLALTGLSVVATQPSTSVDDSAPAGVWAVAFDSTQEQSSWESVALGNVRTDGAATMQVRQHDGSLLAGTYVREGDSLIATLRPLQAPGQSASEHADMPAEHVDLDFTLDGADRLVLSGDQDLSLARETEGSVLFDRGFSWQIRPDDPFER
ncbi:hypothetical protein [Brachybacterium sp. FME24]|uniref:hypothetical protein n=1 Tax=Brachybacterium sp. FME24 TaxID=2742605 RepID=UPI00186712F7|nr:hypothetical protein [Brachybacterium sp. FME24]